LLGGPASPDEIISRPGVFGFLNGNHLHLLVVFGFLLNRKIAEQGLVAYPLRIVRDAQAADLY
jgi:hypothetical protein